MCIVNYRYQMLLKTLRACDYNKKIQGLMEYGKVLSYKNRTYDK